MLALAIGLAFLAVPVAQWVLFDRRWFQSDGSAAGLVFFVFYAGVGVACGALGMMFAGYGAVRIARGEKATNLSRGVTIAVLGGVALVLAGLAGYRFHGAYLASARIDGRQHDRVVRVVPVKDAYALAWKSRGEAPALKLAIPASDFARTPEQRELSVQETQDGPQMVELLVSEAAAPYATIRLHRGIAFVDDEALDALEGRAKARDPATPRAFWVSRQDGGWTVLGFECGERTAERHPQIRCHHPDAPLARALPRLYGLEKVPLHVAQDRSNARCDMYFHYRERIAWLTSRSQCFDTASVATLGAAATMLGRLARDTSIPPTPAERLARANPAVTRCEAATAAPPAADPRSGRDAADLREQGCRRALAVAEAELAASPADAGALMLRVLAARDDPIGSPNNRYIAPALAALLSAGKGESREAVSGHALRAIHFRGSPEAQASREALVTLAPRVLAADDPLVPLALRAAAATEDAEQRVRYVAMLRAWDEKAAAAAPGSDTALGARYQLCRALATNSLDAARLGACADELSAAWDARVAAAKSFDLFHGEAELAASIARMYYAYGFGAPDFAGGVAGVAKVRARSMERFPATAEYDPLLRMLQDLESQLASKARGR